MWLHIRKKKSAKKRKAITSNYILTEDQARDELIAELAEKERKKKN